MPVDEFIVYLKLKDLFTLDVESSVIDAPSSRHLTFRCGIDNYTGYILYSPDKIHTCYLYYCPEKNWKAKAQHVTHHEILEFMGLA